MDFLTWKENEEEMTTTYYVQCTGKRAFSDNGNEEEKGKLYVYMERHVKIYGPSVNQMNKEVRDAKSRPES